MHLEWLDSHSHRHGWETMEDIEAADLGFNAVRTVGWVVREDDHWIMVAQNIGDGGGSTPQACNFITIPKVTIQSRRELQSV